MLPRVARCRRCASSCTRRAALGRRPRRGRAGVYMPDALDRKYPRAGASWTWFWVFPQADALGRSAQRRGAPPPRCTSRRFQRAFKRAVAARRHRASRPRRTRCAIRSPPTCCRPATTSAPCRSCSATADVSTTMIYTHVLKLGGGAVRSPLDALMLTMPACRPRRHRRRRRHRRSTAPTHARTPLAARAPASPSRATALRRAALPQQLQLPDRAPRTPRSW